MRCHSPPNRTPWPPRISAVVLATWVLVWRVSCGIRKEAPSTRLGNVSCGSTAAGSVTFRNVLTLPLSELTQWPAGAAVHVPSTAL